MGLNFDEAENPISNEEEVNNTGGFIDSYNDQFDQLASSEPITESEPDISEEQLEKIKQNMEKAKRLREEKLRKMRENTQDSECTESASIPNDSKKIQQSNEMLTEDLLESEHQVDDEEDIDNILDYINEDDDTEHTENISKNITDRNIDNSNDSNKANNKINNENTSIEMSKEPNIHEVNVLNQQEISAIESTTNSQLKT